MTKGDLLDTLELWDGELTAELRFIDWEIPEHRDTDGYAVPRYSLKIERDGARGGGAVSQSFTGWGSIHEAEEQEPTGTVPKYIDLVAGDAAYFFDHGGRAGWLDRPLTVTELESGDLAPVMDSIADEWGSPPPSDAIRGFRGVVEAARKFDRLGFDRDDLGALMQDARDAEAKASEA